MRKRSGQLFTLNLTRRVANRLKALAKRSGKAQSELIREGLEWRMAIEGRAAAGSVLELAGDLVGALNGPTDLATNAKHLRGFGK